MALMTTRLEPQDDGSTRIHLAGVIDEETDFAALWSRVDGAGAVELDLSGIERLNSIGVHRWIEAIGRFSANRSVTVVACSYVVALQANCVANLFGRSVVRSCHAPYYCPTCRESRMVLVSAEDVAGRTIPVKRCGACSTEMTFDELDNYFDFLLPRAGA